MISEITNSLTKITEFIADLLLALVMIPFIATAGIIALFVSIIKELFIKAKN